MSLETRLYREYLTKSLATRGGGLNNGQAKAIVGKFDALASKTHDVKRLFSETLETFGSENTQLACASIQSELEKALSTLKGVADTNPNSTQHNKRQIKTDRKSTRLNSSH